MRPELPYSKKSSTSRCAKRPECRALGANNSRSGTQQLVGNESVAIYCFQAAASYYGRPTTERHFGLGARTSVDVEVEFQPSGHIVRRTSVDANEVIYMSEDEDRIFADGWESLPSNP